MGPETIRNPSRERIAAVLPGRWDVRATNSPAWLTGARDSPIFEYELVSSDPLVLNGEVSWIALNGDEKRMLGTHHWEDDHLVWRRAQILPAIALPWAVPVISADDNILVARFGRIRASGVDVIVREGVELPELRAVISRAPAEFGISEEELALLSWIVPSEDR